MDMEMQTVNTQPLHLLVVETLYAPEEIAGPVAVVIEGTKIRALWRGAGVAEATRRIEQQMPGAAVSVTDLGSWRLAISIFISTDFMGMTSPMARAKISLPSRANCHVQV